MMLYHLNIQRLKTKTVAKNSTVKTYRGGRTITVPSSGASGLISVKESKTLLGINSDATMNKYLKTLSFFGQRFISWEQFKEILELQAFLRLKHGYNSQKMYMALKSQNSLTTIFNNYGFDIDTRFERLKNDYYDQRQAQKS